VTTTLADALAALRAASKPKAKPAPKEQFVLTYTERDNWDAA
jgi:hypothetical protein